MIFLYNRWRLELSQNAINNAEEAETEPLLASEHLENTSVLSSTSQFTRDQGGGEARGRGAQASVYNRPVVGYIQNSNNRNYGTAINTRLSPSVIRSLESPSLYNSQVKTNTYVSSKRELMPKFPNDYYDRPIFLEIK